MCSNIAMKGKKELANTEMTVAKEIQLIGTGI